MQMKRSEVNMNIDLLVLLINAGNSGEKVVNTAGQETNNDPTSMCQQNLLETSVRCVWRRMYGWMVKQ